jgi:hypothetical protein
MLRPDNLRIAFFGGAGDIRRLRDSLGPPAVLALIKNKVQHLQTFEMLSMKSLFATIPALALILVACSSSGLETQLSPPTDCPDPGAGGYFFTTETRSVEAGDVMSLQPYFSAYPGMSEALPAACLTDVKIDDAKGGVIARTDNGEPYITVANDAREGTVYNVSARYRENSVEGRFSVFNPTANPLVGQWSQSSSDCAPEAVINELIFSADGTFSVTWMPFESYKDYWGRYDFDTETSELSLTVKSGNDIPEDVRSGTVRFTETGFALETASFGFRENGPACQSREFSR